VDIDLTKATADEFASFWFDHKVAPRAVAPGADERSAWYDGGVEISFDPAHHAENFAQMFSAPQRLRRYSPSQLEQGFWAMWSPVVHGGLVDAIWSPSVPWESRERLIRSMVHVFKGLFVSEPLETASYMWWDMIASQLERGPSGASAVADAPKVRSVMFEVVCEILEIEAETCQRAALHGLNHLRHPNTPEVIRKWLDKWLDRHPTLDPKLRAYADDCARFAAA
jgi:hypothetical protein